MELLDKLGKSFLDFVNGIIDVLPKSPIVYLSANPTVSKYLSYINWFIPIYSIISLLEFWIVAIVAFYAFRFILKWTKII